MKQFFAFFTFVFTTLSFAAPAAFGFGIGLQPTSVEMELEPGEVRRQVVTIGNVHTEQAISLTIGLADWSLSETGQIELAPPGEDASSSAPWVQFSPSFVTVEPGENAQIIVDMRVPRRIERAGDHRFALLASTLLPEDREGGSGFWKRYQLASLFYLTVGDAESAPEIVSSSLTAHSEDQSLVQFRVENDGNAHARLTGAIDVTLTDGRFESHPIGNRVVLHESAADISVGLNVAQSEVSEVTLNLENTFAPQVRSKAMNLAPHNVPLTIGVSSPTGEEQS